MKLLVFGKTGQVAQELERRCPIGFDVRFLGRDEADLSDPERCAQAIAKADVDAVINVAAWTAVDTAETAELEATVVNSAAPGAMARACAAKAISFLHVSTDYVFNGSGSDAFTPEQSTAPLGAYGRSKLAGEEAVRASGARHLILRTSWVVSAHGTNFVKTMLRLGAERNHLRVVSDQIGGPTPAAAIADALYVVATAMVAGHAGGTHNFSGSPDVSWANFARTIMKEAHLPCQIEDIPTSSYPTVAQRPLNSRLDCTSFTRDFDVVRPNWKTGLQSIISELGEDI